MYLPQITIEKEWGCDKLPQCLHDTQLLYCYLRSPLAADSANNTKKVGQRQPKYKPEITQLIVSDGWGIYVTHPIS